MKTFLTTLLLLTGLAGFSQTPTVAATKQGWAGGVCCVSGTRYAVVLSDLREKDAKTMEITSVCIDGMLFSGDHLQVMKTEKGNKSSVSITMGISHDENDRYDPEKAKNTYKPESCNSMLVNYTIGKKEFTIMIREVKELEFIAYP